ncbi:MAG: glycosyltransferase [Candidatus Eisenbacteria bacterium]
MQRPADNLAVLSPTLSARVPALLKRSIEGSLRELGRRPRAVIAYLPSWAPVVEGFRGAVRAYHCVDDYAANPGVDARRIARAEDRLVAAVDVVFAVSPPLRDRLATRHQRALLLTNVAEVDRFAEASMTAAGAGPPETRAIPRPHLLYLGNLAGYKVDLDRLARLAATRSDWSWILIGPVGRGDPDTDLSHLLALSNVHWLGEMPPARTPAFVATADVCLLPLAHGPSTESSAPIKIFEYLAAGRPVVSSQIPAVAALAAKSLLRTASDDAEWIAAIEASFRDGDEQAAARRREAMQHGWPQRIEEIERILGID